MSDDAIRNDAVTYDLRINDVRVLEGAPIGRETNNEDQSREKDEAEENDN